MVNYFYTKLASFLAALFFITTVVFFSMWMFRGEVIIGLQSQVIKDTQKEVKVIIEQHESANQISQQYEERRASNQKEKVYVDREVEKIVLMPSYGNECFDAIGLQSLNSQIASYNSALKLEAPMQSSRGTK